MRKHNFELKGFCKPEIKGHPEGAWIARVHYRNWIITKKKVKTKEDGRAWIHTQHEVFEGSAVQDDIDRLKDLITETYGEQGETEDE